MSIRSTEASPAANGGVEIPVGDFLDRIIGFIALERRLILRGNALRAKGSLLASLSLSLRIYVVVIVHCLLYWTVGRSMPGSISYLSFFVGGFTMWMAFSHMVHHAEPTTATLGANVPLRIRWINLFLADFVWTTLKLILGLTVLYITSWLYPAPWLTGDVPRPDFIALFALILNASLLGMGGGILLQYARLKWPPLRGLLEVIMWFLFISSGIYDSYVEMPPVVAQYFVFNPMMTICEFARHALDPGYPVDGLTILYPMTFGVVLLLTGLLVRYKMTNRTVEDLGSDVP